MNMADNTPMGRGGEGAGEHVQIFWEDIFGSVESARLIAHMAEDTGGPTPFLVVINAHS